MPGPGADFSFFFAWAVISWTIPSIDGRDEGPCLFLLPGMADQARCPVEPPFATGHTSGGLRA